MRWMIGIAVLVLAAGCSKGSDRCERLLDKFERQCVADQTRTFSVDGKPAPGTATPATPW